MKRPSFEMAGATAMTSLSPCTPAEFDIDARREDAAAGTEREHCARRDHTCRSEHRHRDPLRCSLHVARRCTTSGDLTTTRRRARDEPTALRVSGLRYTRGHDDEELVMPAKGSAEWKGDLPTGAGTFTAGDTISGGYTYKSRFEDGPGSNPEQLIAAAHAACFSMALSNMLAKAGTPPDSVRTDATVTLRPVDRHTDDHQDRPGHHRASTRHRRGRVHRARQRSQGRLPGESSARERARDHLRSIARDLSNGSGLVRRPAEQRWVDTSAIARGQVLSQAWPSRIRQLSSTSAEALPTLLVADPLDRRGTSYAACSRSEPAESKRSCLSQRCDT